jgi:glyoxylase-like metal-dependent hydrolase (beta-lactamase superfamily II)
MAEVRRGDLGSANSTCGLTHVVAMHGHGDHWFTADLLSRRFGAAVLATPDTIAQMHVVVRPLPRCVRPGHDERYGH